jgi:RNA-directed DNA polymerase
MEKKARRHLMKSRKRKGFGWERWSRSWLYEVCGLFSDYQIKYYQAPKVLLA